MAASTYRQLYEQFFVGPRIRTKGTYDKLWAKVTVNDFIGCHISKGEEGGSCVYCYAKWAALKRGLIKSLEEWDHPRRSETSLRREHKPFKKFPGRVMYPSTHDITLGNYDVCLKTLEKLLQASNTVLIVTKGNLEVIRRLCNKLKFWKEQVEFRLTITSLDDKMLEKYEPAAPRAEERIDSLWHIKKKGYRSSVSVEPFLTRSIKELRSLLNECYNHMSFDDPASFIGPMNPPLRELAHLYTREKLLEIKRFVDEEAKGWEKHEKDGLRNLWKTIHFKDTFLKMLGGIQ